MYDNLACANEEAAEQFFQKGMTSAESGDLHKAVRLLERASRLHPANGKYEAKLQSFTRQLNAVNAEQERDKQERFSESANAAAGNFWSETESAPKAGAQSRESDGPSDGGSQSAGGRDEAYDNAETNADDADGSEPTARRSRSFVDIWHTVRRTVVSLFLPARRVTSRLTDGLLAMLPNDEERKHRLTYLGYFWLGRLEVPLILAGVALAARVCYVFPWFFFAVGCLAVVPLMVMIGTALEYRRRIIAIPIGIHLSFVYVLPYSAVALYVSVLWLVFAAAFRMLALVATAVVLWVWFFPWLTLGLLLLAAWGLLMYVSPLPTGGVSVAGVLLWYWPLQVVMLLCLALAAVFGYDRNPLALPIAGAGVLAYMRPWLAAGCLGVLSLGLLVRWRSSVLELFSAWFFAQPEEAPFRPRDGESAVKHVLEATTHYQVLGISQRASLSQVKSGYKRMALLLHPDKNPHTAAATAFDRLSGANECVSSARRRAAYDIALRWPADEPEEEKPEEEAPRHGRGQRQAHRHERHEPQSRERARAGAQPRAEPPEWQSNTSAPPRTTAGGTRPRKKK